MPPLSVPPPSTTRNKNGSELPPFHLPVLPIRDYLPKMRADGKKQRMRAIGYPPQSAKNG